MLWQTPAQFPSLVPTTIHIWRTPLRLSSTKIEELLGYLNTKERSRVASFISPPAKENFIVGRSTLRRLLGNYLQIAPGEVELSQNSYGKLFVKNPGFQEVQFNLSHSQDLALFAFTLGHPIGVDVEFIRANFAGQELAARFFTAAEYAELIALPESEQSLAFFNCWARKEAWVKALGQGLFCSLDRFTVAVTPQKVGQWSLHFAPAECAITQWSLESFDPDINYVGAVATSLSEYTINFYNF